MRYATQTVSLLETALKNIELKTKSNWRSCSFVEMGENTKHRVIEK